MSDLDLKISKNNLFEGLPEFSIDAFIECRSRKRNDLPTNKASELRKKLHPDEPADESKSVYSISKNKKKDNRKRIGRVFIGWFVR